MVPVGQGMNIPLNYHSPAIPHLFDRVHVRNAGPL